MHLMRLPRELELEGTWNQIKNVFRSYVDHHSPMLKHYNFLRKKDEFNRRLISKQAEKLTNATITNNELQEEHQLLQETRTMKVQDALVLKAEMTRGYRQTKQKLHLNITKDRKQLTFLVNTSETTVKRLQILLQKSEQAIQIADACAKYQSEDESISLKKHAKDKLFSTTVDFEDMKYMTQPMIDEYKVLEKLDNFWYDFNSVKINVTTLRSERNRIIKENDAIKASLKKYLTEIALGDCKYQPINRPISMYSYYGTTRGEAEEKRFVFERRPRPVTCIEANSSNAVQHERRQKLWQQRNNKLPVVVTRHR